MTAVSDQITIHAAKYNGKPHLAWKSRIVREDDNVVVCLASPGTRCCHISRGIEFDLGHFAVSVFQTGLWFNAMIDFDKDETFLEVYCNVAMPIKRNGRAIDWVDLDLDVVMTQGSAVYVVDNDEFEANAEEYGYPAWLRRTARRTVDELVGMGTRGEEPFRVWSLSECLAFYQSSRLAN